MIIRRATSRDFPAVARLVHRSFQEAVAPHFSADGSKAFLHYASADQLRLRSRGDHITYVAVKGGKIVGMAQVKDGFHISMFFVAPAHQRKGIGKKILEIIIFECESDLINVSASPNSVEGYQSWGFILTSDKIDHNGVRFYQMELRLKRSNQPDQATSPRAVDPDL